MINVMHLNYPETTTPTQSMEKWSPCNWLLVHKAWGPRFSAIQQSESVMQKHIFPLF